MGPQVQTGPGKKSKRIVTNSVHNAHNSMTKGMLDEDKVIETCDHANIECFQTCSEENGTRPVDKIFCKRRPNLM